MKKLLLLLSFAIFASCNLPSYVFENKGQTTGLDLTSGKWLLNRIDAPHSVQDQLTNLAEEDLKKILGDKLALTYQTKGLLLPQKIAFNLSQGEMRKIKQRTGFDYFINIRAGEVKNDMGSIDFTAGKRISGKENSGEAAIEIYDLNRELVIYSQKVTGTTGGKDDGQDVHLSKTSASLAVGAFKKLMKDFKNRSVLTDTRI